MWVKAVNPEDGVTDTITNAIRPVVFGKLHHPAEAKHTQSCIVKGGGAGDVRDSNPGVVNHCGVLHPSHSRLGAPRITSGARSPLDLPTRTPTMGALLRVEPASSIDHSGVAADGADLPPLERVLIEARYHEVSA